MRQISIRDRQNGATAVETAIVLPLLILLLFGMIEFGILLYDKAMITNAAREGARYGVMWAPEIDEVSYKYTEEQIKVVVTDWLSNHLISFSDADKVIIDSIFTYSDSEGSEDIEVEYCIYKSAKLAVSVEYPYSFLVLPNLIEEFTGKIILTSVAQMKCEQ